MTALIILGFIVFAAVGVWMLRLIGRPYSTLYETWPHGEPHTW